jgi:hypothetical protein
MVHSLFLLFTKWLNSKISFAIIPIFSGQKLQAYKNVGFFIVGIDALQPSSIILFGVSVNGVRQNGVRRIDVEPRVIPRELIQTFVFFVEQNRVGKFSAVSVVQNLFL